MNKEQILKNVLEKLKEIDHNQTHEVVLESQVKWFWSQFEIEKKKFLKGFPIVKSCPKWIFIDNLQWILNAQIRYNPKNPFSKEAIKEILNNIEKVAKIEYEDVEEPGLKQITREKVEAEIHKTIIEEDGFVANISHLILARRITEVLERLGVL